MPKRKYLKSASETTEDERSWQPPEASDDNLVCMLCGRLLAEPLNRHHLIPLSKGGRGTTTILLHKICHDKIHAVFTEIELKRFYHTIERIRENEDIAAFIKWVQKKEPEFYDRSVKTQARRER